jgi:ribose transport system permease protein
MIGMCVVMFLCWMTEMTLNAQTPPAAVSGEALTKNLLANPGFEEIHLVPPSATNAHGDATKLGAPVKWVRQAGKLESAEEARTGKRGARLEAVVGLTAVLLRATVFGRHIFAIGSNEATARLCGVATVRTKILIYGLAGCLFGLAGLMQLSRLRQGDPTVASGVELDIIAAVIIGGASLSGGVGTVLGSMIGALIMAVLRNGSQQMGWPTYFQEIIIGAVIITAVFLDRLRQARRN